MGVPKAKCMSSQDVIFDIHGKIDGVDTMKFHSKIKENINRKLKSAKYVHR